MVRNKQTWMRILLVIMLVLLVSYTSMHVLAVGSNDSSATENDSMNEQLLLIDVPPDTNNQSIHTSKIQPPLTLMESGSPEAGVPEVRQSSLGEENVSLSIFQELDTVYGFAGPSIRRAPNIALGCDKNRCGINVHSKVKSVNNGAVQLKILQGSNVTLNMSWYFAFSNTTTLDAVTFYVRHKKTRPTTNSVLQWFNGSEWVQVCDILDNNAYRIRSCDLSSYIITPQHSRDITLRYLVTSRRAGAVAIVDAVSLKISYTGTEESVNSSINVRDRLNRPVKLNITLYDSRGKKVRHKGTKNGKLPKGRYKAIVDFPNGTVKKISFSNLTLSQDALNFKFDKEIVRYASKFSKQRFAIDPRLLNFSNATVSVVAKGTTLYKCSAWNFSDQSCSDEHWVVFKTGLIPGKEYNFTINATDPGFGEGSPSIGTPDGGDYTFLISENDAEKSAGTYVNTQSDDTVYYCTGYKNSIADGDNNWFTWFDFNVTHLNITSLDALEFEWRGYVIGSDGTCGPKNDPAECSDGHGICEPSYIRIYDWTAGTWDKLSVTSYTITSAWDNTQQTVIRTNSTPEQSWYNSSTGYLRLAFEHNDSGMSHRYEDYVIHDFVQLTVNYTSSDVVSPIYSSLTELPVDPAIYSPSGSYEFNITVTDNVAVDTVILEFAGVNYSTTNVSSVYTKTFSPLKAGTHTYRWYMNDTSGNTNVTSLLNYTINKLDDPVTLLLNTNASNLTITYGTISNATAGSTSGTHTLFRNGTAVSNQQITTLAAGTYVYKANSTGNENYTANASGVSYIVTVNKDASVVMLTLNGTASNISIDIFKSVNETATLTTGESYIELYESGILVNNGPSQISNVTTYNTAGTFNVTVKYPISENYTSTSATYWITVQDTTAPAYSGLTELPADPAIYSPSGSYEFNITVTDNVAVDTVILEFAGVNYTTTNVSSIYTKTFSPLAAGTYIYRWHMNDTAGNNNVTSLLNYTISKSADTPTLLLNTNASNLTITYGTTSNATAGSTSGTHTLFRNGTAVSNPQITTLAAGNYVYKANSTGNENYSANASGVSYYVTVNKAISSVSLTLNGTAGNITIGAGKTINETATLTTGESYIELYEAGVLVNNGTSPISNVTTYSSLGTFNVTVMYPTTENYTASSETHWITVVDSTNPSVIVTSPNVGSEYKVNSTVLLQANITDENGIDTAYATLIFPNGSTENITLINISSIVYTANFSNLMQKGRYNVTFFANDTSGLSNNSETSYFTRRAYLVLDVIDINNTMKNYTVNVTSNVSGLVNVIVNLSDRSRIKIINIIGYNENSTESVLKIDEPISFNDTINSSFTKFAIDPTGINFTYANITINATGTTLLKCVDYNFTEQNCMGNWTEYKNLTPGQLYTFTINSTDPGFLETSPAVDVAVTPLDNETFVIAYIDSTTTNVSFKVMSTNGTKILQRTPDPAVDTTSRVTVSAMNSTHFVVAWIDGDVNDAEYAIYHRNGTALVTETAIDTNVGTNTDISVTQLGDRWVACTANDADNDADFRVYNNTGTSLVGETAVDGNMNPSLTLQNLVECSAVNSTNWVYFWFDDAGNDASYSRRTRTGTAIGGVTDLDKNIGETGQVAVTTLNNDRFAMIYYDAASDDITIAIRNFSNSVILAPTDIDTGAGTESRVAISAIRQNNTATDDHFVVAWWDDSSSDIKAGIYNATGTNISGPTSIVTDQDATYRLIDVVARDPALGQEICPGKFALAYSNSTDQGIFKTFDFNISSWNGVCAQIDDGAAPNVTNSIPQNGDRFQYETFQINASINDSGTIDRVYANITLPNSTVVQLSLVSATGNLYRANFSQTSLEGFYSFNIVANDTSGFRNNTETGNFTLRKTVGFPTSNLNDGRFLTIIGTGLGTVPSTNVSVFSIFDKNTSNVTILLYDADIRGNFDYSDGTGIEYNATYLIYADPNANFSTATLIKNISSVNFTNRELQYLINMPHSAAAMGPDENYYYRFDVVLDQPNGSQLNAFKTVTPGGGTVFFPGTDFQFIGTDDDFVAAGCTPYPGCGEAVNTTFLETGGNFTFYADVPDNTSSFTFDDDDADFDNDSSSSGSPSFKSVRYSVYYPNGTLFITNNDTSGSYPDRETFNFSNGDHPGLYKIVWRDTNNLTSGGWTANNILFKIPFRLLPETTPFYYGTMDVFKRYSDENGGNVSQGDIVQYNLRIFNKGNVSVNFTVTDAIPENTSYVSGSLMLEGVALTDANDSDAGDFNISNVNIITVTYENLSADTGVNITFKVKVDLQIPNGSTVSNQANVSFNNKSVLSEDPDTLLVDDKTTFTVVGVPMSANVSITKTDTPDPVFNGSFLNYTIIINNTGDADAYNVTLIETYPVNVTFVNATPLPNASNTTWWLGDIANGTFMVVNVTVRVNANATNNSILTNIVNATFHNVITSLSVIAEQNTTVNTTAGAISLNDTAPVLIVTKTDTPDPVFNGSILNYTISINSTGNGTAVNVTVQETYPANVTFVSSSPIPDTSNTTWSLGNLTQGTITLINISVSVNASATNNSILTNTVNVSYENLTGTPFSSLTETNTTVNITAEATNLNDTSPVVIVTVTDTPDPVFNGSILNYTILINNTGNGTAVNVTLFDTFPENVTFVSSSPAPTIDNTTWSLGNLSAGTTTLVNISVLVNADVTNNSILTNIMNVSYENSSGTQFSTLAEENTTVNITAEATNLNDTSPVVIVTVTDTPDPVFNGSILNYTILINNTGNGTAVNVTVQETYPANVTFINSTPVPDTSNTTWSLGNLTQGTITLINISVLVNANATNNSILTNSINVSYENSSGTQFSTLAEENTTVNITAEAVSLNDTAPVVSITLTDTPDPVFNGSILNYTISINNSGNGTAVNVTIHETLPVNVTYVSSSLAPSIENTTWSVGNVTAGTIVLVNISVLVNANATNNSILTNSINVSYENESSTQFSSLIKVNTTVNETAFVFPADNVSISKTSLQDPVFNASVVNYTILINNTGDSLIRNITVKEFYPLNTTYVTASITPDNGTNDTWTFTNLTSGSIIRINVSLLVNANISNTNLNNNISVTYVNATGQNKILNYSENTSAFSRNSFINLSLDISFADSSVIVGEVAVSTVNITNTGHKNITAVNLTITFNDSYLSYSTTTLAPDNTTATTLTWADFTNNFSKPLPINESFIIYVNFTTLAIGTTNVTAESRATGSFVVTAASATTVTVTSTPTPPSGGGGGGGGGGGCHPNWDCGEWSECQFYGERTRLCTDLSNCGIDLNRPALSEFCIPESRCDNGIKDLNELGVDCGGICPPCEEKPKEEPKKEIKEEIVKPTPKKDKPRSNPIKETPIPQPVRESARGGSPLACGLMFFGSLLATGWIIFAIAVPRRKKKKAEQSVVLQDRDTVETEEEAMFTSTIARTDLEYIHAEPVKEKTMVHSVVEIERRLIDVIKKEIPHFSRQKHIIKDFVHALEQKEQKMIKELRKKEQYVFSRIKYNLAPIMTQKQYAQQYLHTLKKKEEEYRAYIKNKEKAFAKTLKDHGLSFEHINEVLYHYADVLKAWEKRYVSALIVKEQAMMHAIEEHLPRLDKPKAAIKHTDEEILDKEDDIEDAVAQKEEAFITFIKAHIPHFVRQRALIIRFIHNVQEKEKQLFALLHKEEKYIEEKLHSMSTTVVRKNAFIRRYAQTVKAKEQEYIEYLKIKEAYFMRAIKAHLPDFSKQKAALRAYQQSLEDKKNKFLAVLRTKEQAFISSVKRHLPDTEPARRAIKHTVDDIIKKEKYVEKPLISKEQAFVKYVKEHIPHFERQHAYLKRFIQHIKDREKEILELLRKEEKYAIAKMRSIFSTVRRKTAVMQKQIDGIKEKEHEYVSYLKIKEEELISETKKHLPEISKQQEIIRAYQHALAEKKDKYLAILRAKERAFLASIEKHMPSFERPKRIIEEKIPDIIETEKDIEEQITSKEEAFVAYVKQQIPHFSNQKNLFEKFVHDLQDKEHKIIGAVRHEERVALSRIKSAMASLVKKKAHTIRFINALKAKERDYIEHLKKKEKMFAADVKAHIPHFEKQRVAIKLYILLLHEREEKFIGRLAKKKHAFIRVVKKHLPDVDEQKKKFKEIKDHMVEKENQIADKIHNAEEVFGSYVREHMPHIKKHKKVLKKYLVAIQQKEHEMLRKIEEKEDAVVKQVKDDGKRVKHHLDEHLDMIKEQEHKFASYLHQKERQFVLYMKSYVIPAKQQERHIKYYVNLLKQKEKVFVNKLREYKHNIIERIKEYLPPEEKELKKPDIDVPVIPPVEELHVEEQQSRVDLPETPLSDESSAAKRVSWIDRLQRKLRKTTRDVVKNEKQIIKSIAEREEEFVEQIKQHMPHIDKKQLLSYLHVVQEHELKDYVKAKEENYMKKEKAFVGRYDKLKQVMKNSLHSLKKREEELEYELHKKMDYFRSKIKEHKHKPREQHKIFEKYIKIIKHKSNDFNRFVKREEKFFMSYVRKYISKFDVSRHLIEDYVASLMRKKKKHVPVMKKREKEFVKQVHTHIQHAAHKQRILHEYGELIRHKRKQYFDSLKRHEHQSVQKLKALLQMAKNEEKILKEDLVLLKAKGQSFAKLCDEKEKYFMHTVKQHMLHLKPHPMNLNSYMKHLGEQMSHIKDITSRIFKYKKKKVHKKDAHKDKHKKKHKKKHEEKEKKIKKHKRTVHKKEVLSSIKEEFKKEEDISLSHREKKEALKYYGKKLEQDVGQSALESQAEDPVPKDSRYQEKKKVKKAKSKGDLIDMLKESYK